MSRHSGVDLKIYVKEIPAFAGMTKEIYDHC